MLNTVLHQPLALLVASPTHQTSALLLSHKVASRCCFHLRFLSKLKKKKNCAAESCAEMKTG